MTEDKSHVGLQLCFICRTNSTAVLLDRRLKQTLTKHEIGLDVCEDCQKKYLKEGVLLMEAEEKGNNKVPTGGFSVIKDKAFKEIFNMPIPQGKICMCEVGVLDRLNNMMVKRE